MTVTHPPAPDELHDPSLWGIGVMNILAIITTAFFFLFHYGCFHLAYAIIMSSHSPEQPANSGFLLLLLCTAGFALAHGFSLTHNMHRDFQGKKPNIGALMFYPYLRIIPMHLIIGAASMSAKEGTHGISMALIGFMLLKTLVDMGMHIIEHRLFRRGAKTMQL